ncbi:MAG: hypothetical protein DCC49_11510 [Acidobacteria bacterium]|nr:MAG: hypothetical protein DCC49_11510 [Acidobacteriota bacterium]
MTSPSAEYGTKKWLVYSLIAVGLILAIAVIAVGIQRSRGSEGGGGLGQSGSTAKAPNGSGITEGQQAGGDVITPGVQSGEPQATPILSQNQTRPGQPNLNVPVGAPPPGIAGVYMVSFQVRADTCNEGSPSTHELEVQVEGESIRVVDRLTKVTMTGGASPDGSLVAVYQVDQEVGRRKDVINAKIDGTKIAGKYFVTPPMAVAGCMIEFDMDGKRVPTS